MYDESRHSSFGLCDCEKVYNKTFTTFLSKQDGDPMLVMTTPRFASAPLHLSLPRRFSEYATRGGRFRSCRQQEVKHFDWNPGNVRLTVTQSRVSVARERFQRHFRIRGVHFHLFLIESACFLEVPLA